MLSEFRGEPVPGKVNVKLSDVFRVLNGDAPRERDQAELFMRTCKFPGIIDEVPKADAMWQLAMLIGIGLLGVLLAAMDRLLRGHKHDT